MAPEADKRTHLRVIQYFFDNFRNIPNFSMTDSEERYLSDV